MVKYLIYFYNIIFLSLPLAVFEITIEKDKGWGSGWNRSAWYAKPFMPRGILIKTLTRVLKIESPLNYHMIVFGIIVPFIFIWEYFYVIDSVITLLACFMGVILFEDFLWFLLNWNFDSLKQLLKGPDGSIWWHKDWIKIAGNIYLPISYFIILPLSILLLILA